MLLCTPNLLSPPLGVHVPDSSSQNTLILRPTSSGVRSSARASRQSPSAAIPNAAAMVGRALLRGFGRPGPASLCLLGGGVMA